MALMTTPLGSRIRVADTPSSPPPEPVVEPSRSPLPTDAEVSAVNQLLLAVRTLNEHERSREADLVLELALRLRLWWHSPLSNDKRCVTLIKVAQTLRTNDEIKHREFQQLRKLDLHFQQGMPLSQKQYRLVAQLIAKGGA